MPCIPRVMLRNMVAAASVLGVRLCTSWIAFGGRRMGVELRQGAAQIQPRPPRVTARRRRRGGRRPARRLDLRTRAGKRSRQLREYYTDTLVKAGRELSVELVVAINRAA